VYPDLFQRIDYTMAGNPNFQEFFCLEGFGFASKNFSRAFTLVFQIELLPKSYQLK
jgi:hypothetical protein